MASSFTNNLRQFIFESGGYSLVAAIVPSLAVLVVRERDKKFGVDPFYGPEATIDPPVLDNATVVPYHQERKRYFCQSTGPMPPIHLLYIVMFWSAVWTSHFVRCLALFRLKTTSKLKALALCLIFAGASISLIVQEYETHTSKHGDFSPQHPYDAIPIIPAMFAFLNPLIYTVCYAMSEERSQGKGKASLLKAYGTVFVYLIVETSLQFVFNIKILPLFFQADTSTLIRFTIRMLSQVFFLYVGSEISWRWSVFAVESQGANIKNASLATFSFYACLAPYLGRIMQGSAENVGQSLLFELAGTVAELLLADSFLKSRTPIADTVSMVRGLLSRGANKTNKVVPSSRNSLEGREKMAEELL